MHFRIQGRRVPDADPFVEERTFQLIGSCRHWARRGFGRSSRTHASAEYFRKDLQLDTEELSVRHTRKFRRPSWQGVQCDQLDASEYSAHAALSLRWT